MKARGFQPLVGMISAGQAAKGLRRLRTDLARRFTQIAISENVIFQASHLAEDYALRGYDALQLAAAIEANKERLSRGLSSLAIVSADTELNNAAVAEGFLVEDPIAHP